MVFALAAQLSLAIGAEPLSPAAERGAFQFADPSLTIELVASEPEVVSPVALAWDAGGRMFVAEMRDYPNANTGGQIRLLSNPDKRGHYQTVNVFADKLPFPNSVLPWKDGVLVTAAPDLWFLRDTNGDGIADERTVLFTGFGTGNQQLRANGLYWGLDGWVYGANGRSDGVVTRPGGTDQWSLRGRDFRFQPDGGEFETLAGRSQFGLGHDDWGNRFLSWNTIPIRHEVFPDDRLADNPRFAARGVLADCLPPDDTGRVFPLTRPPLVFNNESGSHFNAVAGLHIYRGDALGPTYRGNAFMGETLRNLVHRRVLVTDGATFRAERGEQGREFLASTDPWFHPVNFTTGPDGALYIIDFYRQFVEHPDFVPREMRGRVLWREGAEHGRIWRVRRKDFKPSSRRVDFARATTRELVKRLDTSNGWQRDTVQRLLRERDDLESVTPLEKLARDSKRPEVRVAALHNLTSSGGLSRVILQHALQDENPRVREQAVILSGAYLLFPAKGDLAQRANEDLSARLKSLAGDSDARVRLQVALWLGTQPSDSAIEGTLATIANSSSDAWLKLAAAIGMGKSDAPWVRELFAGPKAPARPPPRPAQADPDRQRVVANFQTALQLTGARERGAVTFSRLCTPCHYLQGHGQRVGPDLSGIAARPPEALLVDVLDPSRQVTPDYTTYEITTRSGETITGLLSSETATRITIRHAGSQDESVARSQIKEMRATGRSLMPDGLENGLSAQDIADLLAFLQKPDGELLPK
ncbi:MAG TPA: PVC-type heme-binding CxxCH protein [Verrucomicrobiae bacterium]|nr:PVC-type heme-binding CxxCH protein [Verrucomicrobiae bacterium]